VIIDRICICASRVYINIRVNIDILLSRIFTQDLTCVKIPLSKYIEMISFTKVSILYPNQEMRWILNINTHINSIQLSTLQNTFFMH